MADILQSVGLLALALSHLLHVYLHRTAQFDGDPT